MFGRSMEKCGGEGWREAKKQSKIFIKDSVESTIL
jgi:hypothetical protein